MSVRRLFILWLVLVAGLSLVFLIPSNPVQQPAAIEMHLPTVVSDWLGADSQITEKERGTLGPETEFARKIYRNSFLNEIQASIVFSGRDMTASIHRPERCLPAQGWTILSSDRASIPLYGQDTGPLNVTRLRSVRPFTLASGQTVRVTSLTYYWFVGRKSCTPSHFHRACRDWEDRLFYGTSQRWAYVSLSIAYKEGAADETEAEAVLRGFLTQLVPRIHHAGIRYE